VVQFETAEAARQALAAAAAAVKSAAGAAGSNDAGGMASLQGAPGGGDAVERLLGSGNDGSRMHVARGFSGGWLVDLLHAAVHSSIVGSVTSS
jgi:hypothetical protein